MPLSSQVKKQISQTHGQHANDSGSAEVQIAMLSQRIADLSGHLQTHKHDFHGNRGLMRMVGQRKRLMRYLQRENALKYRELVDKLGIRG